MVAKCLPMIAVKLRRIIQIVLGSALAVTVGYVFELGIMRSNPKRQVAHWLGASVPKEASDFHYYYTQAPGYYQARLFVRMRISKQDFLLLMNRIGAIKDETGTSSQKLPTNFNIDRSITWWNPPQTQDELFFVRTNDAFNVTCVWNADYGYIEKVGPFGAAFNLRKVQKN